MMNKPELQQILTDSYSRDEWQRVLREVFSVRNLGQNPAPIMLSANEIADSAFELGSFQTADERLIGLYEINLNENCRLEQSKVKLRELLRSIYKYDVDGALVVFTQGDKWRLSFISEIAVRGENDELTQQKTEPKRFTYLLGKGEKTRTATDRLSILNNKLISLDDIRSAFGVEALNKEFFEKIARSFYNLVGSTTTKGKKTTVYERIMALPSASEDNSETRKLYQEFAVRLIGRSVFCWFLKLKKSEKNVSLLPENLLSSEAVRQNPNYYHSILEPLFFQTLNTKIEHRIDELPQGCESIPFLNGGLFEPQPEDFYEFNSRSNSSSHINTLKIPDSWFIEFFEKLEQYNFTIDENSPTEIEMSVDPEMLGRIFENLLAEIDPDSGETARKATGSFYTPREIVNYMVDESLLIYLKSKLQTETHGFIAFGENQSTLFGNEMRIQPMFETALNENRWQTGGNPHVSKGVNSESDELETELRKLFSYSDNVNPFNETETEILIRAIDNCKILDPACGSGAFPMGVLHRLVHLLGKLDTNNRKWQEWQKQKAIEETKKAFDEGNPKQRELRLLEINSAFTKDSTDFGRKLFLIENCIYGVDIQPVAAEISKLRCFLTLIVDETIDDDKDNRGVKPLPNLEFKFVTADALLKLPPSGLFNSDSQLEKLEKIRHDYIQSYGEEKAKLKADFKQLQDEIFGEQLANFAGNQDARALALSTWNPFSHNKVDWFDSEWMFGVKAFDIVIGNPPYGAELTSEQIEKYKKIFKLKTTETAILFIERGHGLLKKNGVENYIIPKSFSFASNYGSTRDFVNDELITLGDCGKAFENVKLEACVILVHKGNKLSSYNSVKYQNNREFRVISIIDKSIKKHFGFFPNGITTKEIQTALKMQKNKLMLNDVSSNKRGEILNQFIAEGKFSVIGGKEINRYGVKNIRGKINRDLFGSNAEIKPNSLLVQGIVAHILYPTEHIKIIACVSDNIDAFIADNLNQIVVNKSLSNKAVWSLLSSTPVNWFSYLFIYGKSIRTMRFDNPVTSRIPIPSEIFSKQQVFVNLVDYILFLKELPESEQVNVYVPNSHLVEQFEEVIDALVYELYFEEDFLAAEIEFLKYAERDFKPIEGLEKAEKIEVIHNVYQALRNKDNEIRNNLKLMDIRLADLIMPIKNAR